MGLPEFDQHISLMTEGILWLINSLEGKKIKIETKIFIPLFLFSLVRGFKFYSHSKFQLYGTVLLTTLPWLFHIISSQFNHGMPENL